MALNLRAAGLGSALKLVCEHYATRFPERATVLPGGDDVPEPPYSSCFHLDSKGRACFSVAGAGVGWLPLCALHVSPTVMTRFQ